MADLLQENPEANVALTEANLGRCQASAFFVCSMTYSATRDLRVPYDLQYSLEAAVLEYANFNALGNLDSCHAAGGHFSTCR